MERAYSKRELDQMFKNSTEKNDSWSAAILKAVEEGRGSHEKAFNDMREHELKPILEQTIKTNGRVNKLEKRADTNDRWRAWLTGAAFILVPVCLAVSSWIVLRQLESDKHVEDTIDQKFQEYEFNGQLQITSD